MFWRKKKEIEYSKSYFTKAPILIHESGVRILTQEDESYFLEKIKEVREVQNLILKELGKEYVPESEKKEPAKLVDKGPDWSQLITSCGSGDWTIASAGPTPTEPKKKRKTTKKKK